MTWTSGKRQCGLRTPASDDTRPASDCQYISEVAKRVSAGADEKRRRPGGTRASAPHLVPDSSRRDSIVSNIADDFGAATTRLENFKYRMIGSPLKRKTNSE